MNSQRGRRNRQRGAETERAIVHLLRDAGIAAEKISRSGYKSPDILVQDEYTAESKRRKDGFRTIKVWLQEADIVFIREERVPKPMVAMSFDTLVKLLGGTP